MRARPHPWPWLWAGGLAGLVLAARLREVHLHTGDVAINDQWKIEAADLLLPWLKGTLSPGTFFAPHFEHVPAWTRLTAWLGVALTGRWDPVLQAAVNNTVFAGFAFLILRWLARNFIGLAGFALALLLLVGAALPHAWENITWGFQSQFPFALLFLFVHVRGSLENPAGSPPWWWAQTAGFAGLFTLASMWMAPLAVALTILWVQPRESRLAWFPLLTAGTGLAMIAVIRMTAPPYGAFAQIAGSPLHFLHAALDLLGWPTGRPGAAVLLNLPFFVFALQVRRSPGASGSDRTILALGLWALGQAAALAYARSADYSGYVSRYGDLLLVLILANGLALARILSALPRGRIPVIAFAVIWFGFAGSSLWHLSHSGHAAYFHDNSARRNQQRHEAIQAYLTRKDRSLLEKQEVRWILYQDVNQITSLLDEPAFCRLLPATIDSSNSPSISERSVRWVLARTAWLAGLSLVLLAMAAWMRHRSGSHGPESRFLLRADPVLPWLSGSIGMAATITLLAWPRPLLLSPESRWRALFSPPTATAPLEVAIQHGNLPYPPERLVGAAPLAPALLRRHFSGSDPEGPGLTCTAWSRRFKLEKPWLVIPFAGYPIAHGNGLRLRIEEPDGQLLTELACPGPNAGTTPSVWTVSVGDFIGKHFRIVLYDGRTETDAWVAAAPAHPADTPDLARQFAEELAREKIADAHLSLAWLAVGGFSLAGWGWHFRRRGPART